MRNNPISAKYEPLQVKLVNKVHNLNIKVYNAIKNANVTTTDDLLMFLGTYIMLQFGSVRKATNNYLGVVKEDVKEISNNNDLAPNKSIINQMQNQTYIELNTNLVCAEKELMQEFRTATKPFKNKPTHITDVKSVLQQEFIKNGGVKVTYKNGARMPLDKYFAMATRTARNETQNATAIDNAKKLGTDYVYMAPNHSSCKTCSAMGNRVYCISGKDPSYPSVYGTLFKHGYNCIHPHCRCMLRPYFIDNHTTNEIKEMQESSNRSFDLDERTEQQRQQYQESQAWNHRVWDSQKKFTHAKQTLGDKMPSQLNTKAKFQTAHAKQTPRYTETMQIVKKVDRTKDLEAQLTKIAVDGKIPIVGTNIVAKQNTKHLVDQLTTRHISNQTAVDALKSKPLDVGGIKYNEQGKPSHKVIYDKVTLYVNPDNGNITTIHKTHTKTAKKLKEGKNNGNSNN